MIRLHSAQRSSLGLKACDLIFLSSPGKSFTFPPPKSPGYAVAYLVLVVFFGLLAYIAVVFVTL